MLTLPERTRAAIETGGQVLGTKSPASASAQAMTVQLGLLAEWLGVERRAVVVTHHDGVSGDDVPAVPKLRMKKAKA